MALPVRPTPPADLTDEQSVEWVAVVNRMPADWFPRETHALLAAYCRHVVASRRVAKLIEAAADDDLPALARLLRMQIAQSGAIATLATKLRLSQSASADRRRAEGASPPGAVGGLTRALAAIDSGAGRGSQSPQPPTAFAR